MIYALLLVKLNNDLPFNLDQSRSLPLLLPEFRPRNLLADSYGCRTEADTDSLNENASSPCGSIAALTWPGSSRK